MRHWFSLVTNITKNGNKTDRFLPLSLVFSLYYRVTKGVLVKCHALSAPCLIHSDQRISLAVSNISAACLIFISLFLYQPQVCPGKLAYICWTELVHNARIKPHSIETGSYIHSYSKSSPLTPYCKHHRIAKTKTYNSYIILNAGNQSSQKYDGMIVLEFSIENLDLRTFRLQSSFLYCNAKKMFHLLFSIRAVNK